MAKKTEKKEEPKKVFLGERIGGSRVYDKEGNLISINGVPVNKPIDSNSGGKTDG